MNRTLTSAEKKFLSDFKSTSSLTNMAKICKDNLNILQDAEQEILLEELSNFKKSILNKDSFSVFDGTEACLNAFADVMMIRDDPSCCMSFANCTNDKGEFLCNLSSPEAFLGGVTYIVKNFVASVDEFPNFGQPVAFTKSEIEHYISAIDEQFHVKDLFSRRKQHVAVNILTDVNFTEGACEQSLRNMNGDLSHSITMHVHPANCIDEMRFHLFCHELSHALYNMLHECYSNTIHCVEPMKQLVDLCSSKIKQKIANLTDIQRTETLVDSIAIWIEIATPYGWQTYASLAKKQWNESDEQLLELKKIYTSKADAFFALFN